VKSIKFRGAVLVFLLAVLSCWLTVADVLIFDDESLVKANPNLLGLKAPTDFFSQNIFGGQNDNAPLYRPILMVSLYLNKFIFGHSGLFYHLVNVLLHGLAAMLLFMVFGSILGFSYRSLIPALIFAVHPVHVDAVGFIINRSEILSLIFLSSAFLVLVKDSLFREMFLGEATDSTQRPLIKLCLKMLGGLFFTMALFSRETAATVVLILFVYLLVYGKIRDFFSNRNKVVQTFIFIVFPVLFYLGARILNIGGLSAEGKLTVFPDRKISEILPTMSRVFFDYWAILLNPSNLEVNYTPVLSRHFFDMSIMSYLAHLSIIGAAIYNLRRGKAISFLIFSFYISLLPVSHIFPFFDIKAIRFLYMPSIFFAALLSYPIWRGELSKGLKRSLLVIFSLIIVIYLAVSMNFSSKFRSEEKLWQAMIDLNPGNLRYQFNLGLYLWKNQKPDQAIPHLKEAIRINPRHVDSYVALGTSYFFVGRNDLAEKTFQKGLEVAPYDSLLNKNYAVFNYFTKDFKKALKHIKRSLQTDPTNPDYLRALEEIERVLASK
jgi:protein O-mannosyl-transferase